jgi:hypothetical protein
MIVSGMTGKGIYTPGSVFLDSMPYGPQLAPLHVSREISITRLSEFRKARFLVVAVLRHADLRRPVIQAGSDRVEASMAQSMSLGRLMLILTELAFIASLNRINDIMNQIDDAAARDKAAICFTKEKGIKAESPL